MCSNNSNHAFSSYDEKCVLKQDLQRSNQKYSNKKILLPDIYITPKKAKCTNDRFKTRNLSFRNLKNKFKIPEINHTELLRSKTKISEKFDKLINNIRCLSSETSPIPENTGLSFSFCRVFYEICFNFNYCLKNHVNQMNILFWITYQLNQIQTL